MGTDERDGRPAEQEQPFSWTVSRCIHNFFLCLLLILFQLVLTMGVYIKWGPYHAAFALVFLTIALMPFYGVYRYVLDADQLRVYGPLYYAAHSWKEFSGWRVYEDEVRLVFREKKGRSVLVLYAPGQTLQVITEVQRRLPPATLEDRRL